jgi:hypothetical protein
MPCIQASEPELANNIKGDTDLMDLVTIIDEDNRNEQH